MRIAYRIIVTIILIAAIKISGFSQELNCNVEVNSQKVRSVDRKIFDAFESSIFEFMNNRKWSSETYAPAERIDCSIFITIEEELGNDRYAATASIQLSRPVFNSDYNSTVLNFVDRDLTFEYIEFQPLEYNDNIYVSNLTSFLAFYAYLFLGFDNDTYAKNGGTPYLAKAESVLNTIPSGSNSPRGWKPFDGQRNRYWIITDLLNSRLSDYRAAFYQYHLEGLDMMYSKPDIARDKMLEALKKIQNVQVEKPTSFLLNLFISAKSDEVANAFSQAPNPDKTKVINIMAKIDPTNISTYTKKILGK